MIPLTFDREFRRAARSVRWRLASRLALSGAAVGALSGALANLAARVWVLVPEPLVHPPAELTAWALASGSLEPAPRALVQGAVALAFAGLGAVIGIALAQRRRWSDRKVALYLDGRLAAHEVVSTALEHHATATPAPAARVALTHAAELLHSAPAPKLRPRVLRRHHGALALGLASAVGAVWLPVPSAAATPAAPGTELIRNAQLSGLEALTRLDALDGRDAAQRARLREIAKAARQLRADLALGLERREALARIAQLQDAVRAEQLNVTDAKNRPGLEAALRELSRSPALEHAQKALGDGDVVGLDEEMEKLANQAEAADRESARKALEDAARAARERGAEDVARLLDEQSRKLGERGARSEALRELAKALGRDLGPRGEAAERELGQSGDPAAARELADALADALEGLTPEERERLAERLRQSGEGAGDAEGRKQLEALTERLRSKAGKDELRRALKELANRDPSEEAERQRRLGEADRGGADAQKQLGLLPVPGAGGAPKGGAGEAPGQAQQSPRQSGPPGANGTGSGGPGQHPDQAGQGVKTDPLRSKANARIDGRAPLLDATQGRAPARPGEVANEVGTGAIGRVAPSDLSAVEGREVPEEYREQVGRYFEP
jgi:hypothetical protein